MLILQMVGNRLNRKGYGVRQFPGISLRSGGRLAFWFGLVVEPEAYYSPWPHANPVNCAGRLNLRSEMDRWLRHFKNGI